MDGPGAEDFGKDVLCLGSPNEWFRISVVMIDVSPDGFLQMLHRLKNTSAQPILGGVPEKPFNHVQP